jgi:large subunit ribosomal protein L15
VDAKVLHEKGIISKIEPYGLKVLGNGELNVALKIRAAAWTKGAEEKIKKAGGEITKC